LPRALDIARQRPRIPSLASELSTEDAIAVASFRAALRVFLRQTEQTARRAGLTPQRYLLLLMIKGARDGSERSTVTELADRWVPHATADQYDEALKLCAEEAAKFLVDEWEFTIEDAFIFLSVACDAGVAQACKPAPGGFGAIARFSIPKIDATPQPFAPK